MIIVNWERSSFYEYGKTVNLISDITEIGPYLSFQKLPSKRILNVTSEIQVAGETVCYFYREGKPNMEENFITEDLKFRYN